MKVIFNNIKRRKIMEENNHVVYVHINKENKKVYVGQSNNIQRR
jgi:predicted GIY-YIG superfamily endonuclease